MTADSLTKIINETLHYIYDPEIPANIYDLGLIYDLDVTEDGKVSILMTLTAPGCPVASDIIEEVRSRIGMLEGVEDVKVELTFEPQWTMDMMSEEARLELGFM